jgi:spermidine/putrescine transport system permease protein
VTFWLLLPVVLFLGVFLVAPLGVFFVYSFWSVNVFALEPGFSLENYRTALTDPNYRTLFKNTLEIALVVGAITTVVAYGFAHVLRFHLRRYQEILLFVVLIALFSGYLVRIYAWRTILGNNGLINSALEELGLIDEPLTALLFSRAAVILVLLNYLVPLAILPIYAAMQNVRDDEVEASRDLGAGAVRTFWKVTLPRARTGVFAAFALTFILSAGDYLTPTLVGGPSGAMIGTVIADNFGGIANWPLGSATSFLTVALMLGVLGVVGLVFRKVVR